MSEVTCDISVSVDGFAAGPNQTLEEPFGDGDVERVHEWMFEGREDNVSEVEAIVAAGAFIMGRNMFSPGRGGWDLDWKGWWGEDPPYHAPVFVLTHHQREPLVMEGGTTYTFVTDGIESALEQARAAAGDRNVAIAGGPATLNQYLAAGLIDELRLHVAPLLLGVGERVFEGAPNVRLQPVAGRHTDRVTHMTYRFSRQSSTKST